MLSLRRLGAGQRLLSQIWAQNGLRGNHSPKQLGSKTQTLPNLPKNSSVHLSKAVDKSPKKL